MLQRGAILSILVSIIEDEPSVRNHLADTVSGSSLCRLAGTASNRAEAMTLFDQNITDVYLVDLGLPDVDGVDLISHIKTHCQGAQSMVLSNFGDAKHVGRSIRAGATGYLLKEEPVSSIIDRIVALHNGVSPLSPRVAKVLVQQINGSQAATQKGTLRKNAMVQFQMSTREVDVLRQLAAGMSIVQIGAMLEISTHTVNQHLRSLYRKLSVHSRSMAVHVARQNGLLEDD